MSTLGNAGTLIFTAPGWADDTEQDARGSSMPHIAVEDRTPPTETAAVAPAAPSVHAEPDAPASPVSGATAGVPFDAGSSDAPTALAAIVNDASYTNGSLWGMYGDETAAVNKFGSQAGEAWAVDVTGSMNVAVGVIDTGINYTHVDLYLNIWLNQGEIPVSFRKSLSDVDADGLITFRDLNNAANSSFVSDINKNGYIDGGDLLNDSRWENGIDEDGNGYRDDLIGWDFWNNDNDPWDDNGHGTHVAGTIGAMGGNGVGVAGVNWDVSMVALKYAGADGGGLISRAALALDYFTNASKKAVNQDFVATNNSWSTSSYSTTLQMAINRAAQADILTVAAAGNNSRNTDSSPSYPSSMSTTSTVGYESVISVASINSGGGLSWFSNYGANSVDIAAPGENIVSTTSNGGYGGLSGTSMAAPHVTGAVALYASLHPGSSAAEIRTALLDSAARYDALAGKTVSGGSSSVGSGSLGGDGDDTLSGVPAEGDRRLGHGTVDVLTGGAGNDVFVLGDARGVFYNDGKDQQAGMNHYARIMDFETGDRFQVAQGAEGYLFREGLSRDGFTGTAIYIDTNGSGRWDKADEMIALVVDASAGQLSQADLIFV